MDRYQVSTAPVEEHRPIDTMGNLFDRVRNEFDRFKNVWGAPDKKTGSLMISKRLKRVTTLVSEKASKFAASSPNTSALFETKHKFVDYEIRSFAQIYDQNILRVIDGDSLDTSSKTYPTDSWQARFRLHGVWWICGWHILWTFFAVAFGYIFWPCEGENDLFCIPRGAMQVIDILLILMYIGFAIVARFYVAVTDVLSCTEMIGKRSVMKVTVRKIDFLIDCAMSFIALLSYMVPGMYPVAWIFRLLSAQHIFLESNVDPRALQPNSLSQLGWDAMVWVLVFMFIASHIICCVWFLIVSTSWQGTVEELKVRLSARVVEDFGWTETDRWYEENNLRFYEWSFHFAIQSLTNLGVPMMDNWKERLVISFMVPIQSIVMSLVLSRVIGIMHGLTLMSSKINAESQYLELAMRNLSLPQDLRGNIRRFHNYVSLSIQRDARESLNETVSYNMKCEMQLFLFNDLINNAPFFQTMKPTAIVGLIMNLVVNAHCPGDIIIRKGDVGKEMFFIIVGTVEVSGSIMGGPVYALKKDGDYFGEIALVLNAPRTAYVISRTYCRIATLSKESLDNILGDSPEQQRQINDAIKNVPTSSNLEDTQRRMTMLKGAVKGRNKNPKMSGEFVQPLPGSSVAREDDWKCDDVPENTGDDVPENTGEGFHYPL